MADYKRRLAERVRHEHDRKSWSRETLAAHSGVSAKTIKRIENQEVDDPRPVTIRHLAEALSIEPDQLRPPAELEQDQLNRIETKLDEILRNWDARWALLESEPVQESARSEPRSARGSPSRGTRRSSR